MSKSPDAFRTISEASEELGVPQHVLRFWETKFAFVRPMKRAGGRRLYRPQDLAVLRGIKTLLHDEGVTIRGVQKLHKEHGVRRIVAAADPAAAEGYEADSTPSSPSSTGPDQVRLRAVLASVEAARRRLDAALSA